MKIKRAASIQPIPFRSLFCYYFSLTTMAKLLPIFLQKEIKGEEHTPTRQDPTPLISYSFEPNNLPPNAHTRPRPMQVFMEGRAREKKRQVVLMNCLVAFLLR